MNPKFADVGADLLKMFLGQSPGKGKLLGMSLTRGGDPRGTPNDPTWREESPLGAQFGSSQPRPAAHGVPANLLYLGVKQGFNGVGEGSGVPLAPLSPIRVTLGSHDVPSALSGGHTMSPGSGTAAGQSHSRAGVWTGGKHPHPEEFLRNLHPCSATAAPCQPFPCTVFPQGSSHPEKSNPSNPSCTSHPLFPIGISPSQNAAL